MDAETTPAWRHRPPPTPAGARATWSWSVTRPAELTAARNALRADLAAPPWAGRVPADDLDRLLLAFEELFSNGLRHGGPGVTVRVDGCDEGWLLDVIDARPDSPPVPALDRDPALGGLGLHLVARLSTAVGWAPDGPRKHVWAALRTTT